MNNLSNVLTQRFAEALEYAFHLHANQTRKGKNTPYFAHLLGVTSLVLEMGGDEDEAIAALLHDAVEDQGGEKTLNQIKHLYGKRVASIVKGCTDSCTTPKPPWTGRKEQYLEDLKTASIEVLRVSLADKLHNARTIVIDLRKEGDEVWQKFNGGKEGTLWYYQESSNSFERLPQKYFVDEFQKVIHEIEEIANANDKKNMKNKLEMNQYQELASRTSGAGGNGERRLIIAALGLAGEAGEFANKVKKRTAHGHNITNESLADELGDVLWYLAEAATACGLNLDDVASNNIQKLSNRYPDGFSSERSINRET
ncbi:MAG TPA: HD domain-containing protein [Anaerolineae bacterium]|nr:HD domain-containing protein [Anaerolineae bacterium]